MLLLLACTSTRSQHELNSELIRMASIAELHIAISGGGVISWLMCCLCVLLDSSSMRLALNAQSLTTLAHLSAITCISTVLC